MGHNRKTDVACDTRIARVSALAILGAGPLGTGIAHRVAQLDIVREIRIVDSDVKTAAGKALDIQQSGPVEGFETKLSASADVLAAAGADVIVIADSVADGEWTGGGGLNLVKALVRAGVDAPFVFAGPGQVALMEASYREAKAPAPKLIGTGASPVVGAVKALVGLEIGVASVELAVVGRPPALVIGWAAAASGGVLVTDRVPAHRLLAISQTVAQLPPPGPYAISTATARVVRGLIAGSRELVPALTLLDGVLGARGSAVMLPLELGHGRVLSHVMPSLSAQERTRVEKGIDLETDGGSRAPR